MLQLGALHEVLEKLQAKRLPLWEKKFGQVPTVPCLLKHVVLIDIALMYWCIDPCIDPPPCLSSV